MKFSHFFIRRPVFAGVLSVIVFLIGLIAMWRLPISEYPEVVPPTEVVQAAGSFVPSTDSVEKSPPSPGV